MQFSFFQGLHDSQIARSQHFSDQISILVTGLSLTVGLLGYLAANFSVTTRLGVWLFWMPVIASAVALSISIGFLVRVYYCPELQDLAAAQDWFEHLRQLQNKQQGSDAASAVHIFESDLVERYVAAATHNQKRNDLVGVKIASSNRYLVVALCTALLSTPPYFYGNHFDTASRQQNIDGPANSTKSQGG